jgi:hypothetical protein
VIEDEGLLTELLIAGPALPARWLARLPRPAGILLEELKRHEPLPLWMRPARLDAWPDIHEAIAEVAHEIQGADPAARKAAYAREINRLRRSPNPLAAIVAMDLGKWDDLDAEGRSLLERLVMAAR